MLFVMHSKRPISMTNIIMRMRNRWELGKSKKLKKPLIIKTDQFKKIYQKNNISQKSEGKEDIF